MTPTGSLTVLASFTGSGWPGFQAGLVQGDDGNFYGTTYPDINGLGALFRVTTNGDLTILASFNWGTGGAPRAELCKGADGFFYGATGTGYSYGTIFRADTNGNLRAVYRFSGPDGSSPESSLVQAPDGALYGTARHGGIGFDGDSVSGGGTIFRVLPVGLPVNDTCETALVIASAPFTTNESTLSASSEDDPLPPCTGLPANSVWFRFTAPAGGLLMVDTVGSDFDTVLTLYTGACGALNAVACNDDWAGTCTSAATAPVVAGTTCYIQAGGYDGANGRLKLNLSLVQAPVILGAHAAGADLVVTADAGLSGWSYQLLTSTNMSKPLAQWTPVSTSVLSASGTFALVATNALATMDPHRFFALRGVPAN